MDALARANAALKRLVEANFEVQFVSHAFAILSLDFPGLLDEIADVLVAMTIPIEEIIGSGGGETKGTQRLRRALAERGWPKHTFQIEKRIDGTRREAVSHEVDHVKAIHSADGSPSASIALEIEWNNKDPFFDRDLENFKRLHAEGAISTGIVVTRGSSLQASLYELVFRWVETNGIQSHADVEALNVTQTPRQKREVMKRVLREVNPISFPEAWTSHFVSDKFGMATTHWSKLQDRVHRGVGNPCPLLLIGIPASVVTFGEDSAVVEHLIEEGAREIES